MIQARIAIPSTLPGGLESAVGEHFGHCDLYTVVDVTEGKVAQVGILPNVPHEQGGCLGPVNHLGPARGSPCSSPEEWGCAP